MNNETSYSGTGFLIINVRTSCGAVPVEGALVSVCENCKFGERKFLYSLTTNKTGLSEKISLPAPSAPNSTETPYAVYCIEVSKSDYTTVVTFDIPVFENVTSIQTIDLNPNEKMR